MQHFHGNEPDVRQNDGGPADTSGEGIVSRARETREGRAEISQEEPGRRFRFQEPRHEVGCICIPSLNVAVFGVTKPFSFYYNSWHWAMEDGAWMTQEGELTTLNFAILYEVAIATYFVVLFNYLAG